MLGENFRIKMTFEEFPYLEEIIREMCKRVGANFDDIIFKDKENLWFHKYEWIEEEQKDFENWLVDFFRANKGAREELMETPSKDKKIIEGTVRMFILNYGWKLKNKNGKE